MDPEKIEQACVLYQNSEKTAAEVCKMVGIGKRTLFKYLAERKKGGCKAPRLGLAPGLVWSPFPTIRLTSRLLDLAVVRFNQCI
ncbi:hypothetical protein [Desulfobacula toluolica]|uniref:hypothetical protein n=1 Tax=Desulfobacula toluolica TaxID=28223 RepID=UPI0011D2582C